MGWNWDGMGYWDHMGWAGAGWSWLFFALLVIGVAVLVVVLVRVLSRQQRDAGPRSRAREILDERYARGEIDATEYDERRRHLDDRGTG